MKKLFPVLQYFAALVVFICSAQMVFAQKEGAYEMMIEGVKVIVQPSNNEIVEIQTVLKGGVQNYPLTKQGIESLAMKALTECGTATDDKNSFKNKLDKVSAQINGRAGMDYATISMNCIKSDFDVVWPLYATAILTPKFDEKEFARIKQDAINNLKSMASEPDYAIQKLAKQTAFKGKDYAKSPEGSEKSVIAISNTIAKEYYHSVLTKSRLLIVIVGDIGKDELTQKLQPMLSKIPKGENFSLKKLLYMPAQNSFIAQKSELATNYIQGITGAPVPGSPDFNAFTLAMRIFGTRHFLEVRSKNGLSYAPQAYFDGGASPSANIFVSTTKPDKYINVVKSLVQKIKKEGFTEQELKNMKTTYITRFFYSQETNEAQAASFVTNEVLHNNWRRALTINNDLKNVTLKDINQIFNKYINNLTWAYRGDPTKVNPQLYTKTDAKNGFPKSKIMANKKG